MWEYNIKMNLRETGGQDVMDWIIHMDQRWALVNMAMKLQIPQNS
jgi:hypothetical protein